MHSNVAVAGIMHTVMSKPKHTSDSDVRFKDNSHSDITTRKNTNDDVKVQE